MEKTMRNHGFSVAFVLPHATEHDDDEDALAREHGHEDGSEDSGRLLDLRIKLAKAELKHLEAIRDGDEAAAAKAGAEMQRLDRAVTALQGHGSDEEDDDHGEHG
jgi:hypothetical protein